MVNILLGIGGPGLSESSIILLDEIGGNKYRHQELCVGRVLKKIDEE